MGDIYCRIVYHGKKVESPYVVLSGEVAGQSTVQLYPNILFCLKEKGGPREREGKGQVAEQQRVGFQRSWGKSHMQTRCICSEQAEKKPGKEMNQTISTTNTPEVLLIL